MWAWFVVFASTPWRGQRRPYATFAVIAAGAGLLGRRVLGDRIGGPTTVLAMRSGARAP
jgi:hypothetical protein